MFMHIYKAVSKSFLKIQHTKNSHVCSCHAAEVLLEDGQNIPHRGGESLRVEQAEGAATLRTRDED